MRYLIGNENGMPVYRVCEVVDFEEVKKPYAIDGSKYIDFDVVLRHGDASKTWAMDKVSNSRPSDVRGHLKIAWACVDPFAARICARKDCVAESEVAVPYARHHRAQI